MEILEFLTRNEPISGLEISDGAVRAVQLKNVRVAEYPKLSEETAGAVGTKNAKPKKLRKKYYYKTKIIGFAEEPIEEGVIVNGELAEPDKLKSALIKLFKKTKGISRFVVVTLPDAKIYSHYFSFPATIGPDKIAETMRLTMEYQLPFALQGAYADWQKANPEVENTTLLAGAPKDYVKKFLNVFAAAGLNVVAVEFSLLSVARTFNQSVYNKCSAVVIFGEEGMEVGVIEGNALRFSRFLPFSFIAKNGWAEELRKIADFYESENHRKIDQFFKIGNPPESKNKFEFQNITNLTKVPDQKIEAEDGRWLVSLGAALRGVLRRSEDKLLSLMAIRTEEAYETKKALAFAGFISSLIMSISVFMVAIYAGIWLMTVSLQRSISEQIRALSAIPAPVGGSELEARANALNELIAGEAQIVGNIPRWSLVVESFKNQIPAGITVQSLSFPEIKGTISVAGSASDRASLKIFKKSLDESGVFTDVVLPISNISLKENIPFSLTMRLTDPAKFYYQ